MHLLSGRIFVSAQTGLGFSIAHCAVYFPCWEQNVWRATADLSVLIFGRYGKAWTVS